MRLLGLLAYIVLASGSATGAPGPDTRPAVQTDRVDARFFEQRVRPVLVERCLGCHSGTEPRAGLDLSHREALRKHPAFGGGRPAGGRLLRRILDGTMPPQGGLPRPEREVLRRWLAAGMPWRGGAIDPVAVSTSRRAGLDWWSLQPLRAAPPPAKSKVKSQKSKEGVDWARVWDPIDAFVRKRLLRAGLDFAPPAPPAVLIRRVTFDLTGLPPTPEEVEAFVKEIGDWRLEIGKKRPKEQSPVSNLQSPISNLQPPSPYERLVDRLLASPRYGERMARRWLDAARFAESDGYEHDLPRLNAWPYRDWVIRAFNTDMPYERFVREQLAGDALHPGEPEAAIPTGFLVAGGYDSVGAAQVAASFRAEVRQDELEDMIGTTAQVFLGMTAQCARCHDHKFDPIPQRDYYRLQAALAGAQHYGPKQQGAFYAIRSEAPPTTWLFKRGAVTARGETVSPGGLTALRMLGPDLGTPADGDPVRRRRLAEWITDPRNPLPARVMANRVWGWIFGEGIVATPNDFGFNGDRPSHPELLEWLAAEFGGAGPHPHPSPKLGGGAGGGGRKPWSVKSLVRTLVLSRTYQQSAAWNGPAAARDAGNRLRWRHAPRRLEAEELRDSILATAGRLNLKMGGPGFQLFTYQVNAGALYTPRDPDGEEYDRRAIYRMVVRGAEDPLLAGFDCPDASVTTPRRPATTTATQALSLLNNSFTDRQSAAFAERLRREAPGGVETQVRLSYRLALGRASEPEEQERAHDFAAHRGLAAWCRVLFNTSEFLSIE